MNMKQNKTILNPFKFTVLKSLPELVVIFLLHRGHDPSAVLDFLGLFDARHKVRLDAIY
jgi:hypothetical protein